MVDESVGKWQVVGGSVDKSNIKFNFHNLFADVSFLY